MPKYKPVKCPQDTKKMCRALNKWAGELERWGKRVKRELDRLGDGGPGNVPPPPPRPFQR